MAEGLLEGMKVGIDHFFGLAVVLVRIAEQFSQQASGAKITPYLKSPQILYRLARAMVRARVKGASICFRRIFGPSEGCR